MTIERESSFTSSNSKNAPKEKTALLNTQISGDGIRFFERRVFENCSIAKSNIRDFRHTLLSRASGKSATFSKFDFKYAELTDCYFHGANFQDCDFTGAKIRRSNFRTATFDRCIFDYITIEETPIDYEQVVKNLPDRPNVAQEILHALRRNAVTQGEQKAVRDLTLREVDQEREHLRRASKRQGEYYRKKYGSWPAQLKLRARSLALLISSVVWGHGEKISRLLATCFGIIVILSMLSAGLDLYQDPNLLVHDIGKKLWSYFNNNLLEFLGASPGNAPKQSIWVDAAIAVMRVVFGGMFVAYIFRLVSRR